MVTTTLWDQREAIEAVRTREEYDAVIAALWNDFLFALNREPYIHETVQGHLDGFELAMRFVRHQLLSFLETKLGQSSRLLA